MLCLRGDSPSSAHARGAVALLHLAAWLALSGCVSSTAGATLRLPGPAASLLQLEHLGQPPPSARMCMDGEPGCIETGWGPGWDQPPGQEGPIEYRHVSTQAWQRSVRDRTTRRVTGPCRLYWEHSSELGSAPVGDCR
jgi:hypothetical protein